MNVDLTLRNRGFGGISRRGLGFDLPSDFEVPTPDLTTTDLSQYYMDTFGTPTIEPDYDSMDPWAAIQEWERLHPPDPSEMVNPDYASMDPLAAAILYGQNHPGDFGKPDTSDIPGAADAGKAAAAAAKASGASWAAIATAAGTAAANVVKVAGGSTSAQQAAAQKAAALAAVGAPGAPTPAGQWLPFMSNKAVLIGAGSFVGLVVLASLASGGGSKGRRR